MEETIADLLRSIRATAGSRFSAAKRVSHLDSRFIAVTALASVCIIVTTVLPYLVNIVQPALGWLNFFTIALSILVLVVSLLHYACQFGVKSELFHRSALEIQELKRELQLRSGELDREGFSEISSRYNDILKKFAFNHADEDFWRHQLEYPQHYKLGGWEKFRKRLQVANSYFYPTLIILLIFSMTVVFSYLAISWPTS